MNASREQSGDQAASQGGDTLPGHGSNGSRRVTTSGLPSHDTAMRVDGSGRADAGRVERAMRRSSSSDARHSRARRRAGAESQRGVAYVESAA